MTRVSRASPVLPWQVLLDRRNGEPADCSTQASPVNCAVSTPCCNFLTRSSLSVNICPCTHPHLPSTYTVHRNQNTLPKNHEKYGKNSMIFVTFWWAILILSTKKSTNLLHTEKISEACLEILKYTWNTISWQSEHWWDVRGNKMQKSVKKKNKTSQICTFFWRDNVTCLYDTSKIFYHSFCQNPLQ